MSDIVWLGVGGKEIQVYRLTHLHACTAGPTCLIHWDPKVKEILTAITKEVPPSFTPSYPIDIGKTHFKLPLQMKPVLRVPLCNLQLENFGTF